MYRAAYTAYLASNLDSGLLSQALKEYKHSPFETFKINSFIQMQFYTGLIFLKKE